jgi:hypothetical protein
MHVDFVLIVGAFHRAGQAGVSPDAKILVSGCKDKTIKIWDAESGKLLRTLSGHRANRITGTLSRWEDAGDLRGWWRQFGEAAELVGRLSR